MAFFVPSLRARLIPLSILAGWVGFATSGRVVSTGDGVSGILGLEYVGVGVVLTCGSGVSSVYSGTEILAGFGGVAKVSVGGAGKGFAIALGGDGGGVCITSA
jgi:hypothetical protein